MTFMPWLIDVTDVGMMFVSLFTFMLFSFPATAQPTTGKLAN